MKITDRPPLSLAARVMIFVGLAIGLSLILIGSLLLSAVERHFAEQDAGELAVMTQAVAKTLLNGGNDSAQQSDALANAISGHHGVFF